MADVWDSAVHVVMWKDPSLPIYRVENHTTKNSKVVHRNFLLPVNFLPLEEPDIESTVLSTVSEEEKDQTEDQRSLFSMGRESRSRRTAAWIFQGAALKVPQSTGKCAVKTKEHVIELEKSVCVSQTRGRDFSTRSESEHTGSSSDEHEARDMNSESEQSEDENGVHELQPNQLCSRDGERLQESVNNQSVQGESIVMSSDASSMSRSFGSSKHQASSYKSEHGQKKSPRTVSVADMALERNEGTVRTRAGRLVKPIRCLLECMSMILTESGQKDPLAELLKILSSLIELN